jgi:hypothetical protein
VDLAMENDDFTQKLAELTMENDDFTKILGIYDI